MIDPLQADIAAHLEATAPSPFVDWSTFWDRDRSEPEWVVEDVLARRRGHAVWAKGGTGKSEFMQWVALQAITAGHVVIYLDYEMIDDDLFDRLVEFGCGPETDLSRLRYALIPELPPLNRPEGAEALAAMIDAVQAAHPDRHVVVMVDTIGRALVGEENSNDTIMDFYRHAGAVLKVRGVTWVRLDHTGHEGEHARGGSAKRDDVDVVWKLERTDGGCVLRADKRRMSWIPEKVDFDRREEPLLRYERVPFSWPAKTAETAADLERLGVPIDAPVRVAQATLKGAEVARRKAIVAAAQRYRNLQAGTAAGTAGTAPHDEGRNRSGTAPENPHGYGPEPLGNRPEPLAEATGNRGAPYVVGPRTRPEPDPTWCPTCQLPTRQKDPGEPYCRGHE